MRTINFQCLSNGNSWWGEHFHRLVTASCDQLLAVGGKLKRQHPVIMGLQHSGPPLTGICTLSVLLRHFPQPDDPDRSPEAMNCPSGLTATSST
ncbi:MAG: hypothetical protein R3C02_24355 [Planctomycetaceae bacterium]